MTRQVFLPGPTLRHELEQLLGADGLVTEVEALARYQVEGLVPALACFPGSTQEVAEIVKLAGRHGAPVVPWGHGSKQSASGGPLLSNGLLLCLDRMVRPLQVEPSNLTAQTEAGIGLSQLARLLEGKGLFLPLDPPDSDRATLGGCLAAGSSGPRRLGYGAVRDLVLGVTVVLPSGEIVRSGGKTMKNVAGYNLRRLFVGAWGSLGIITEATLRLLPPPESRCLLAARFNDYSAPLQVMADIMASRWLPAAAELVGPGAGQAEGGVLSLRRAEPLEAGEGGLLDLSHGQWLLLLQLEAAREVVERQRREATAAAVEQGAVDVVAFNGGETEPAWEAYRRRWQWLETQPSAVRLKTSLLFTRQSQWLHDAAATSRAAGLEARFTAHAGNGIVYLHLVPGSTAQEEALEPAIDRLGQLATRLGGFQVLEVAPIWLKRRVKPPRRSDYGLMARLKATLDPQNLLNPGRAPAIAETE